MSQTWAPRSNPRRFPCCNSRCPTLRRSFTPLAPEFAGLVPGDKVDVEGKRFTRVLPLVIRRSPIDDSRPRIVPCQCNLLALGNSTVPDASKQPPALRNRNFNTKRKTHGVEPISQRLGVRGLGDEVENFAIINGSACVLDMPLGVHDQQFA